ncbi:MAG: molecular chaperone DnaJ [Bdellovibrionaceae bacterium]|nr:molecular chaperone DnaJ [Bdellovibrio sp.]
MSTKRDYYEILTVERPADGDTIKKSYRKLAMQFHPDRNPGDKPAEEKFKEAAEAYEILSNAEKRAQYDRFGHQAFQGGRGSPGGGFNDMNDIFSQFGDIFGDIFGGSGGGGQKQGRSRNSVRRGADLRYVTEIELKDVLATKEQNIEFDTEENCGDCNGSGAAKGSAPITCKVCGGSGQVVRQQGFFTMASTCHKCHGSGEMIEKPCTKCEGKGRNAVQRKIKVTIPAGVDNGTRLRVTNEGEGGYRGGPNGDLFVEIRVKHHEVFEREGDHLFANLDVSYIQFLVGGELKTEALDGELSVDIPRGSKSGERVKVAGHGLPSLRGSRRGDLYYTLNVEFPKKLSEAEEKLIRQLAEISKVNVSTKKKGLFK